jgi:hypothetical protein
MNPPWIEFPDIPWASTAWRMGHGELYWAKWVHWYRSLLESEQIEYMNEWPEGHEWIGFYSFVGNGPTPPWAEERRKKLAEPQNPPTEEEDELTEYFRIFWLLRHHFKREAFPLGVHGEQRRERADEYDVEFHSEPSGAIWRLGFITKGGLHLTRAKVDA